MSCSDLPQPDLRQPKPTLLGARAPQFGRAAAMAVLGLCAIVAVALPAVAEPRAVVELFTSQGCAACPPADRVLGELAKDPSIVALSLPIDYWDYLGWKDTLADSRFSERQKAYARMHDHRGVYTPQAIVNGVANVLGSDRPAIDKAIGRTHGTGSLMSVPVTVAKSGRQIKVSVEDAEGRSDIKSGEVWICAVSRQVPITISRGENRGKQVTYHNVVRNVLKVGDWNGKAASWNVPLENIAREGVDAAAVYLQDGTRDKPGAMLGAAFTAFN